jgi:hypothetical protein
VLIAAVGLVFVLGMVREQSTTAALLPPSDGWFSSGQTVSVPVTAGESKTVYWDFENEVRRVRATAKCVARDRQSGAAIALTPIGGDLRVDNRKALATMKPPRSGTVDLTCMAQGARRSQFGVAKEIPAPRPLNGVEAAGRGIGLALTALALLVPACIVLALIPLRPAVRAWLFGFFAPLLFAVVLALGFNSVMPGLLLGVVWYAVLGFRRLRSPDRGRPHAPDRAVGQEPGP